MSHLQKHHSPKRKVIKKIHPNLAQRLENILQGYQFSTLESVMDQPVGRPPIPGITVHEGYYCPVKTEDGTQCLVTYPARTTMERHLQGHKGVWKPKAAELDRYLCSCQTISTEQKRYFRVLARPLEDHASVYTMFVEEEMAKVPGPSAGSLEKLKTEELPSLLRGTQWHEYVMDFRNDPKDVVDLIAFPDAKDKSAMGQVLSMLPGIAETWMQQVREYRKNGSENMKKCLNGLPIV